MNHQSRHRNADASVRRRAVSGSRERDRLASPSFGVQSMRSEAGREPWRPSFPTPAPVVHTVQIIQTLPLPGRLQPKTASCDGILSRDKESAKGSRRCGQSCGPSRGGERWIRERHPGLPVFVEGALYRLYAAPQEVSDIALQPGENLTAISAGDTT